MVQFLTQQLDGYGYVYDTTLLKHTLFPHKMATTTAENRMASLPATPHSYPPRIVQITE